FTSGAQDLAVIEPLGPGPEGILGPLVQKGNASFFQASNGEYHRFGNFAGSTTGS
ncbi:hypothetical protein LCGC14_2572390, partial [marine sediment metagenome]